MWKRVHNNFVNSVISTLALANRSTSREKIYQMPKLTLVGTTVTDVESGKQIDPDSTDRINNHHYIVKMIFNMQDLGDTTIIYNTTKPNKITYTNAALKALNKDMGFGVGYDYLDCDFKDDRPDLLFIDRDVNDLAKRIVNRFARLQEAGSKAKQAVKA